MRVTLDEGDRILFRKREASSKDASRPNREDKGIWAYASDLFTRPPRQTWAEAGISESRRRHAAKRYGSCASVCRGFTTEQAESHRRDTRPDRRP